jgi:hypothetical protein
VYEKTYSPARGTMRIVSRTRLPMSCYVEIAPK